MARTYTLDDIGPGREWEDPQAILDEWNADEIAREVDTERQKVNDDLSPRKLIKVLAKALDGHGPSIEKVKDLAAKA